MKSILYYLLLIAIATCTVTACNNDDGPSTYEATVYDIVCLAGVDKTGSSYTLTRPQDNKLITYLSHEIMDTTYVKPGNRFMLAYIPSNGIPYTSGYIKPTGYSLVTNDTLRYGYISKKENWDRDPVYMLSNWMSQDYLNIRARLPYDTRPRLLAVMVDSLTLDNEYPDCYLIHCLETPVNTFDRTYYLSFDMGSLRKLEHCRGFNLKLNNNNQEIDNFRYELKAQEKKQ